MFKHIADLVSGTKYSVVKQPETIEENLEDDSELLVCSNYAEIDWFSDKPAKITDFEMMIKAINANAGWLEVWHDEELGERCFTIKSHYVTERIMVSQEDFCALRDAGIQVCSEKMQHHPDGTWSYIL